MTLKFNVVTAKTRFASYVKPLYIQNPFTKYIDEMRVKQITFVRDTLNTTKMCSDRTARETDKSLETSARVS